MGGRVVADAGAKRAGQRGERDYRLAVAQVGRDGQRFGRSAEAGQPRAKDDGECFSVAFERDAAGCWVETHTARNRQRVRVERRGHGAALHDGRKRAHDRLSVDEHGDDHGCEQAGYDLSVTKLIAVFRGAGKRFSVDGCAFMAQAVAFNALFAIFPLITLALAVLAFIYGNKAGEARGLTMIASLAPSVQPTLAANLQHIVAFRGISGTVALIALIWSGKNLFQALAYALNRALNVPQGRPLVRDILVATVMLPVMGLIFLIATALPVFIAVVIQNGGFRYEALLSRIVAHLTTLLLVLAITVILYTFLPNRRVSPALALPGAIVTTTAWLLAQVAFAIYSTHVDYRHVYGALAAVAVLLLWFYYMATIFLFGAEFSAQWFETTAGRSLEPDERVVAQRKLA